MEKEGRRFVEKGKERTVGRGGKKRRKCRPWRRSSVATVILKVSKGRLKKKKQEEKERHGPMQVQMQANLQQARYARGVIDSASMCVGN